jgi:hypothetical protein
LSQRKAFTVLKAGHGNFPSAVTNPLHGRLVELHRETLDEQSDLRGLQPRRAMSHAYRKGVQPQAPRQSLLSLQRGKGGKVLFLRRFFAFFRRLLLAGALCFLLPLRLALGDELAEIEVWARCHRHRVESALLQQNLKSSACLHGHTGSAASTPDKAKRSRSFAPNTAQTRELTMSDMRTHAPREETLVTCSRCDIV